MLFSVFKILILIALIKLLEHTEKPFLCAGIYALLFMVMKMMLGAPVQAGILFAIIAFALASLYFWLLNYLKRGWVYWLVLVGGILLGLV